VPKRIGTYEDLIGCVEATLREDKGHAGAKASIAHLRGLLVEAQQQAATD
jgi:hypothetical protein